MQIIKQAEMAAMLSNRIMENYSVLSGFNQCYPILTIYEQCLSKVPSVSECETVININQMLSLSKMFSKTNTSVFK